MNTCVTHISFESLFANPIVYNMVLEPIMAIARMSPTRDFSVVGFNTKTEIESSLYKSNRKDFLRICPSNINVIEFSRSANAGSPVYKIFFSFLSPITKIFLATKRGSTIHVRGYGAGLFCMPLIFFKRVKLIWDPRGLFIQEAEMENKVVRNSVKWRLMWIYQRYMVKHSNLIIFVSYKMERYFKRIYIEGEFRSVVIPNAANETNFPIASRLIYKKGSPLNLVFLGSARKWHDLEKAVHVANTLSLHVDVSLDIITNDLDIVQNYMTEAKANFQWKAFSLPVSEIPKKLACYNLGFNFRKRGIVSTVASPVKLHEMLTAGICVLSDPRVGDIKIVAAEKNNIFFVGDDFGDVDAKKLLQFLDVQPDHKISTDGYYSFQKNVRRLESAYNSLEQL